jgi:hypothetical protein
MNLIDSISTEVEDDKIRIIVGIKYSSQSLLSSVNDIWIFPKLKKWTKTR